MKVLVVCSGTSGKIVPFITEQVNALINLGLEIEIFQIKNKGIAGYLKHHKVLKDKIKFFKPDLIHAHFGLSGLLANLQRQIPVITTFHGSDINERKNYWLSSLTARLSAASIFVEAKMMSKVNKHTKCYLIPCGVDTSVFMPCSINESRSIVNFPFDNVNILFSSSFDKPVKNYPLAKEACSLVEKTNGIKINLIELKGYERQQVNVLMNACNCALLTSHSEGSPQFIKEAMSCNCPVVSTEVGDVRYLLDNLEGCYITPTETAEVAKNIILSLAYESKKGKTKARDRIFKLGLDQKSIALRIMSVYNELLKQ